MAWLRRVIGGFRDLFQRTHAEQELEEEIRDYLETAAEQKILTGMEREDAIRAARAELGSREALKDRVRDVSWASLIDALWQDLRYGVRMLRKSPGFAVVAIFSLALGIGANTAIFTVVNSLVLRPLPVIDPHRLATISSGTSVSQPWSYAIWSQIRQRAEAFGGACAWSMQRFNAEQGAEGQPVEGMFASGEFFTMLGVPAVIGRTFTSADDERGGGPDGPVAVLSYAMWHRHFGGSANVIGMSFVVEGVPFTIVGVTPPEFFGVEVGRRFDVALPIGAEPLIRGKETALDARMALWLRVMLRLPPGQSLEVATATLRAVQPQIREGSIPQDFPQLQQGFLKEPFTLVPAAAGISALRQRYERPLLTIQVLVALVLLIACANLANLLLARATARRHELSVRLALGAAWWRLVRQLLIESFVLAGIGAFAGLAVAAWGSRALVAQLSTSVNRVSLDLPLDWRVMAFTAAVAVATAVLFGTAPAFRATRAAPIDALKEQRRTARDARLSFSSGLVVAQLAVSMVLVLAAGLLVRTFERLATLPLGFESDRVLVVTVDAMRASIDPASRSAFYYRLVDAAAAAPGVANAAGSMFTPVTGGSSTVLVDVPGAPAMSILERTSLINFVTPRWLATYGMAIHAGRDIDIRDTTSAPPVVLVNEAFARSFFPGRDAIGQSVGITAGPRGEVPVGSKIIVGIVDDAVYGSVREKVRPTMYMPLAQWDLPVPLQPYVIISVRSATESPALLTRPVAAALTAVDRDLVFTFRPLSDQVDATLMQERLIAILSGLFGTLALLLAAVGLYGVTTYAVSRRRAEIGIRLALGAQRSDIIRLVLAKSLVMTGVGIVLGLAAGAAVTRYVEGMLFGLTPLDPTTFIAVSLLFAAVSTLAAFVPARRATTVDPLIALRCE
jgi:putative ABC transport system permease protein